MAKQESSSGRCGALSEGVAEARAAKEPATKSFAKEPATAPSAKGAPANPNKNAGGSAPAEGPTKFFPHGFFSQAVAVLPLSAAAGRTTRGVVFANGSDWSPQPLVMYEVTLDPPSFDPRPKWVSDKSGYYSGICSGDLDGKDGFDFAVTALQDVYGGFRGPEKDRVSRVEIYLGTDSSDRQGAFAQTPIRIPGKFQASSCAIADVDGDGVSEILVGSIGASGRAQLLHRKSVDDNFEARDLADPCLEVTEPFEPAEVAIEDVNNDGQKDLLLAGKRLAIYYGGKSGAQQDRFAPRASWCSDEDIGYSPSIHVARVTSPARTLVTVTRGCTDIRKPCSGAWLVYDPAASTSRLWERAAPEGAVPGAAALTSMRSATGDDIPDLVVSTQYVGPPSKAFGGPLQIYPGQTAAPHEPAETAITWHPEREPVASKLLPINLFRKKCADLLVVSSHPVNPSALFTEVGQCATE